MIVCKTSSASFLVLVDGFLVRPLKTDVPEGHLNRGFEGFSERVEEMESDAWFCDTDSGE